MKRIVLALFLLVPVVAGAQEYSWSAATMDGSRSSAVETGNAKPGCCAAKVIKIVADAQPAMSKVKEVIGVSAEALSTDYPVSALSNWTVDTIMEKVEELSGKKVHIGFANFGGIRVDMPKGEILLDDILSMFPFKNNLVYLEHKGSTIRAIIEWMAAGQFQIFGGMSVVVENGKVKSIMVGDQPLEDDKVYGVATNSFLLHGGDGLYLSNDAISEVIYDSFMMDAMLEDIRKTHAQGKKFEYVTDSRIVIR